MGNKFKFAGILCAALILCAAGSFYYIKKSAEELFGSWILSYDSGDDAAAGIFANKLDSFNSQESAFFLAHMAVTDFIKANGKKGNPELSDALRKLEDSKFSMPGSNQAPVIMLKASISALLGDKARATAYASEACKLNRPMSIEECLNGPLSFGEPGSSRWVALQNYEQTNLYNVIGDGDKTKARFYEALSLKYFNLEKANFLRNALISENKLTNKMQEIYCSPTSPADPAACKIK